MNNLSFDYLSKYQNIFWMATRTTLGLALFGVLIGTALGTLLALMRRSKWFFLRWPAVAYIEFMRGTPLLVQVTFAAFALPQLLNFKRGNANYFSMGSVVLGLNSAAYIAEIIRSGIQSVDKGQMEAARSLGMGQGLAMRRIILPQAIKNILPALGNEFVSVIKESSILNVLGVAELMYTANRIGAATYTYFQPLIVISLIYFAMTFTLSKLLGVAERSMDRSRFRRRVMAQQAAEAELLENQQSEAQSIGATDSQKGSENDGK